MAPPPRTWPRLRLSFLILGILALAAVAAQSQGVPLPADHWNVRALARIKAEARTGPLDFAVLGDSRNGARTFARLLDQARRDPSLKFMVHLGDMVPSGQVEEYRPFFRQVRGHLSIPLLGVIGNHELARGDGYLWDDLFGPRYYAFRVRGHCFIALDDNPEALDDRQLEWLAGELERAQECETRLVFMHLPLFDPPEVPFHHALPAEMAEKLASLFQKFQVTYIFAGHIHGYFTGQWSGIPYTITGGAGVPLPGIDPEHYFYHYLKVELSGSQARVQVQRLAGEP